MQSAVKRVTLWLVRRMIGRIFHALFHTSVQNGAFGYPPPGAKRDSPANLRGCAAHIHVALGQNFQEPPDQSERGMDRRAEVARAFWRVCSQQPSIRGFIKHPAQGDVRQPGVRWSKSAANITMSAREPELLGILSGCRGPQVLPKLAASFVNRNSMTANYDIWIVRGIRQMQGIVNPSH